MRKTGICCVVSSVKEEISAVKKKTVVNSLEGITTKLSHTDQTGFMICTYSIDRMTMFLICQIWVLRRSISFFPSSSVGQQFQFASFSVRATVVQVSATGRSSVSVFHSLSFGSQNKMLESQQSLGLNDLLESTWSNLLLKAGPPFKLCRPLSS